MIFYKNIFISAILSAIILLVIIAVTMYYTKNKQLYPPILSRCPDFYYLDSSYCVNSGTWTLNDETKCDLLDFSKSEYNIQGTGPTSGLCAKKKLAVGCGISWDGITNNYSIC
jgi:hypothetical protein